MSARIAAGPAKHDSQVNWAVLIFGGLCEAGWAYCLNRSRLPDTSYTWAWLALFMALYVLSAVCLAYAVRTIPVGTAYAVWTGIGALGTITMGIVLFHEPLTVLRLVFMLLIFTSLVGLKL